METTNRSKRLVKDIGLFAIASFGPKLLSFFLVPLYTSCLTTEAYGVSDLLSTIVSLLLPIMMLDISDAIMIYTIEGKRSEEKNQPLKFGTEILLISTSILGFISIICGFIFRSKPYFYIYLIYVLVSYFTLSLYNNLLAYLRGRDRVNAVVVASIINSFICLASNILLILYLDMGLNGLLISSIIGTLASDVYVIVSIKFFKINKMTKSPSIDDKKKMLSYSVPLIFTGLAWWVNSSSDRLFISVFASVSINGIYAVANKIPTILSACHSIVYQAMQLSVFKEIHSKDKNEYLRSLYDIYSFIMMSVCSGLIIFDKFLAKFLFKGDFFVAWKYSPALLISIVFFSIAGYLTTIYAAEKETKLIAKATVIGAIINSVLNILLIPKFELYGAVIATVIGYFIIWLIMILNAKKITGVELPFVKNIICSLILVAQWIVLLSLEFPYFILIALLGVIFVLYRNTIVSMVKICKKMVRSIGLKGERSNH